MKRSSVLNRRDFLRLGAAALTVPAVGKAFEPNELPLNRQGLLEEIERRACRYFYDQAHPDTGLVRDRVRVAGFDGRRVASIAATGFGLSALCIGSSRGYIPTRDAIDRAETTLSFLARRAPHRGGFFYHFADMETGQRALNSEISSVDTAWLLCGILHLRSHFDTPRIRRLSAAILDRVDWRWMLNGGETLSHGWMPESGFLPYRWDCYSELLAMYLLAIASTTFPIPVSSWDAWERPSKLIDGGFYIDSPAPLFVHQYSHAWFDFRRKQDGYADYFENSRRATAAHRDFCIGLSEKYPWFGPDMWGITASDSRDGYVAWGAPGGEARVDGTLVPCAPGGSLVFLPEECIGVLEAMLDRYGKRVWNRYGFVDAFHPHADWYCPDVIGIDLGIMLLMAENYRSESVWQAVMSSPEAIRGLKAAGFYDFNGAYLAQIEQTASLR